MKPETLLIKSVKKFLVILILTLSFSTAYCQLSGTYTIGDSQDYPDIEAASNELYNIGVSGPVVFNIVPGTYSVHVTIPHIVGSSEVNTVTFQSSTQNSSDVILQHVAIDQNDNWVLYLNGPDNISFKHLTFKAKSESPLWGAIVIFDSFCSNVTFSNNAFYGKEAGDASAGRIIVLAKVDNKHEQSLSNLHFTNNYFFRGSYALHFQGPNDVYQTGVVINNNTFEETGYICAFCNHCYAPQINNNTMEAISYGIRVSGDYGGGTFTHNKIYAKHYGMDIQSFGEPANRALISNNFITIGDNGNRGLSISNSDYTDVLNNSVYVLGSYWNSTAFYSSGQSNDAPSVRVINNNFSNEYNGYSVEVLYETVISEMTNNNLYTAGNYIATWGYVKLFDLKELQDKSGLNENSLSVYPHYIAERDLHSTAPWLDGKGISVALVSEDIDGESRSGSPDIGADEFTPDPAFTTPLDGTQEYTIGAGGSYPDFESAMADALIKGISAPVSFGFLEGTYDNQFVVQRIPGSSDVNRITIQSANNNTENAQLTYSSESQDENYVFKFKGADFVTLKNLDIEAKAVTYTKVIDLTLGCDSVIIENNKLSSPSNTNNITYKSAIFSDDSDFRSRIIRNNEIIHGALGIFMCRYQSNFQYPKGAVIEGNTFDNIGYLPINLQFYDSPQIIGNTINAKYKGIQAHTCIRDLRIQRNKINIESGDAVYLSSCTANEDHFGIISNNFITAGGTSQSNGLSINNTSFLKIYYNSINITSTRADSRALYISSTPAEEIELYNNIFANQNAGVAAYFYNPSFIVASDYNNFFCRGDNLVYWGENVTNLDALQTLSSMDTHSVSGNPFFTSNTDLHTDAVILDSAATYIASFPTDIDGDIRNLNFPDIGADEFGIGVNQAPYLDKPIPDQEIEWNTGVHDIAFLDTIFIDPDPGDVLSYSVISMSEWILAVIENKILKLSVDVGSYGTGEIQLTATDPMGAYATDTFVVEFYVPPNHAPVAVNDTVLTSGVITIEVLENDYDDDSDDITIVDILYTGTAFVSIQGDNKTLLYDPISFLGVYDTITYYIKDVNNARDTAMVFITIFRQMDGMYLLETELEGLSHGSIKWGDYDNDGDLDILQNGWTGTLLEFKTKILTNTGDGFIESDIVLEGLSAGTSNSIDWIDIDNDNDLDIIITGLLDGDQNTKKTMIYVNTEGAFSELENTGIENLNSSSVSWGDINHDGRYDLLISGTEAAIAHSLLYLNTVSGFTEVDINLTGTQNGENCFVDIDNDGDLDIFMSGTNIDPCVIYINGPEGFTETVTDIPGIINASVDWADIDYDGDMDIAIMGKSGGNVLLQIYTNEGMTKKNGEWFSLVESLTGVESGDLAWADYDNDGDMDLVFTGTQADLMTRTNILQNEQTTFIEINSWMINLGRSSLSWGDYDNDGDLDLALQGANSQGVTTAIYRNDREMTNLTPSIPDQLQSTLNGSFLELSWKESSDELTSTEALRYNVKVGTSSNGSDILSPMSDNSFLKKTFMGNAGNSTSLKLTDLESGTYYWSVQAVDQGFMASDFSSEEIVVLVGVPMIYKESGINIFPNPAKERIWISIDDGGDYNIKIIELSGREVLSKEFSIINDVQYELMLDNLKSGIYIINIKNSNKTYQSKLIIQ